MTLWHLSQTSNGKRVFDSPEYIDAFDSYDEAVEHRNWVMDHENLSEDCFLITEVKEQ